VALLLTGISLLVGYVSDVAQSAGVLLGIRLLFAFGTALFAIVTLVLAPGCR
jgi:Na+/melibiose symporter-like transporter